MNGPPPATSKPSGATKKFTTPISRILVLLFTPKTSIHQQTPRILAVGRYNKMSEGEIEVEAVSGYEVLPKEVIAEIGSVKLFSMCTFSIAFAKHLEP